MDTFTQAYIECALWAEAGEEESPIGVSADISELAPETLDHMKLDCAKFQAAHGEMIADDVARAGHDFWLTRRGHGAGFWDGDWPEPDATILTDAAHAFGDFEIYRGDDGLIYS